MPFSILPYRRFTAPSHTTLACSKDKALPWHVGARLPLFQLHLETPEIWMHLCVPPFRIVDTFRESEHKESISPSLSQSLL
jgi:hypothetical protein